MTHPLAVYGGRWDGLTLTPPASPKYSVMVFLTADSHTLDHDAGYTFAERISEYSRDVTLKRIDGDRLVEVAPPDAA